MDDGSSDGTKEWVYSLLAGPWKGHDVIYKEQENAGASSARNLGLSYARGDYVQFLDSDDELLPEKIFKQVRVLEGSVGAELDMCYCFGMIGRSEALSSRIGASAETVDDLIELLVSRVVHVMSTPAPLWRRRFLIDEGGWRADIGLGDDLEYYLRLVTSLTAFGFVPEELFFVREHESSRLSADRMTRESLLSSVRTQHLLYETLNLRGRWSSGVRARYANYQRGLYANCLTFGSAGDVADFEAWVDMSFQEDKAFRSLRWVFIVRRLIGAKALYYIYRLLSFLVRSFSRDR